MHKEIRLNEKYYLAAWRPADSDRVSIYLTDKVTERQVGPLNTITFVKDLRTLDLIRVSDTEALVKVNDTAVTVLVKETSITVAS